MYHSSSSASVLTCGYWFVLKSCFPLLVIGSSMWMDLDSAAVTYFNKAEWQMKKKWFCWDQTVHLKQSHSVKNDLKKYNSYCKKVNAFRWKTGKINICLSKYFKAIVTQHISVIWAESVYMYTAYAATPRVIGCAHVYRLWPNRVDVLWTIAF